MTDNKKRIGKIFTTEVIRLDVSDEDWVRSVRSGGDLLVKTGKCLPRYIEAMIQTVNTMGPYMVIAPGLALVHARPEDGVLQNGLSLITLKTPVEFGATENDPVDVAISFCAINHTQHIIALEKLAELLRQEENQTLLRQAQNVDHLLMAFKLQG